ncbi:cobalamin biosynthesis protein [Dehalococcoides mccartyi]|nr:cobalamin biosynthesis protein [Dehalococcoides mccartyi]AQX73083.1 cobalamin biosynthesis protein CobD [Dehalococcoides mccartyi]OBW63248.1 MAG: cobalamin biosynthesis protein CobD [Dehalococcoides mccartyi]
MEILLIFLLALVIDMVFGDPPNAFHPVAYMGKVISLFERAGFKGGKGYQFVYGIVMVIFTMALFFVPVYFLLDWLQGINSIVYIIVSAILFKMCFTVTGLRKAALLIKRLLEKDDIAQARFELRSLVSRDTSKLPQPKLVAAAVESVAESIGDGFVAPLFFFLIFGVPGVMAYRVVSTFDSMVGYRGKYEYLGKFAARFDDVLNFIPARLSALCILVASFFGRYSPAGAWRIMWRDHGKTQSPNAGWPMATAAGALEVCLEKVGHYSLGDDIRPLLPQTISRSLVLINNAGCIWVLISVGVIYFARIA